MISRAVPCVLAAMMIFGAATAGVAAELKVLSAGAMQPGDVFVLTLGRTVDAGTVPDRILAQQAHHALGLLGG